MDGRVPRLARPKPELRAIFDNGKQESYELDDDGVEKAREVVAGLIAERIAHR